MINTVKAGTAVPDGALNQRSPRREDRPQPAKPTSARAAAEAAPDSDLRLVIERDPAGGDYVYRLIDRTTGLVVTELPRDQVSELATAPSYEAGAVVSTKA